MKIVLKFKSGTKLLFFEDVKNLRFDPIPDCSTDIFAGFPHRHTGKQNSKQYIVYLFTTVCTYRKNIKCQKCARMGLGVFHIR